jgi:hypothetical protein
VVRATFATLLEHFHYTPWDLERLTDRQIVELCYHPRRDGNIEVVPDEIARATQEAGTTTAQPALEKECLAIDALVWAKVLSQEAGERAKAKVRAKYRGELIPDDAAIPVADAPRVIRGERLK